MWSPARTSLSAHLVAWSSEATRLRWLTAQEQFVAPSLSRGLLCRYASSSSSSGDRPSESFGRKSHAQNRPKREPSVPEEVQTRIKQVQDRSKYVIREDMPDYLDRQGKFGIEWGYNVAYRFRIKEPAPVWTSAKGEDRGDKAVAQLLQDEGGDEEAESQERESPQDATSRRQKVFETVKDLAGKHDTPDKLIKATSVDWVNKSLKALRMKASGTPEEQAARLRQLHAKKVESPEKIPQELKPPGRPKGQAPYTDYTGLRFPTLDTAENFDYHKDRGLKRLVERAFPIKVPAHRKLDPYLREYIHFLHSLDPARFTIERIAERYRLRTATVQKVVQEWGANRYLTRSGLTTLREKQKTKESVVLAAKERAYGRWVGFDELGDQDDPETDDEAVGEFRGWRSTQDWVRKQRVEVEMMSAFPLMEKRDPMPKRVDVDMPIAHSRGHKIINWIDPTDMVVF